MLSVEKPIMNLGLLFIILLLILFHSRHPLLFDEKGNLKNFGTGPSKTVTPLWMASIMIITLVYVFYISLTDEHI